MPGTTTLDFLGSAQQYALLAGSNFTGPSNDTVIWDNDFGVHGVSMQDIVFLAIVFLAGVMAAAAGVGGGAIYTPLYILLFNLVYESIPLSKAAVCGSAVAFYIFNIASPVPTKLTKYPNRFAYDVIMIMEPATLLGTTYGVLASRFCPMWLVTLAMTSLLGLSASKTFAKASKLRAKEDSSSSGVQQSLLRRGKDHNGTQTYGSVDPRQADDFAHAGIYLSTKADIGDETWLGWRCISSVGICFASVLFVTYLDNSDVLPEPFKVECNSIGFWIAILLNTMVCGLITLYNLRFLVYQSHKIRRQCSVDWTPSNGYRYSFLCLGAGFMSALCGIGGSTIKGPILLEMNLSPILAKATSQVMLLSTVSSSAFQFYFSNEMPPRFGLLFFVFGAMAGFTGKYLIDWYVANNGRQSTIAYLLAWYIVVASLIMTSIGVIIVIGQVSPSVNYDQLWFRSICSPMPNSLDALKWLVESPF